MIDLVAHQIIFETPERLTTHSYWHEHLPFGMFLVSTLRPRVLVELGTHYGDSYCAFCQTVQKLDLDTLCYAIDNWQGDPHIGQYGSEVYDDLRAHHDPRYSRFSVLVKSDFDKASRYFRSGMIDLLHVDGSHTYEAVRHDFETWLPKMSECGVMIFHDTNVLPNEEEGRSNFGVRRFFDEVKTSFPHFEFFHGFGLGLLAVGPEQPEIIQQLLGMSEGAAADFRAVFAALGGFLRRRLLTEKDMQEQALVVPQRKIASLQAELLTANTQLQQLHDNLQHIQGSKGWQWLQTFWRIKQSVTGKTGSNTTTASAVSHAQANQTGSPTVLPGSPTAADLALPQGEPAGSARASLSYRVNPEIIKTLTQQVRARLATLPTASVRPIALYLPQFHRVPENDQWWGAGFTEWTNTKKAQPLFEGHHQPQIPTELGYYDLSEPDVLERQAALAKEYGIYGFCFYYYWFNGKRLLEKPVERLLASGRPDFPFCFLWANETWNRRWDGHENETLIEQTHSDEDDLRFIHNIIPALRDPRYIRINGRPLLIIYCIGRFTARTIARWREECQRAGVGDIYVAATLRHALEVASLGKRHPRLFGCDGVMEFPPHDAKLVSIKGQMKGLAQDFRGDVFDYIELAADSISKPTRPYPFFRGVMTAWDNTPRRGNTSWVFYPDSPEGYGYWLSSIVEQTIQRHANPDERLIFINAWNEWAEGAHLEPDQKHGRRLLEETKLSLGRI